MFSLDQAAMPAPPLTTYTAPLTGEQVDGVAKTARERRFRIFAEALHDLFRAEEQTERRSLRKGPKLLLQGKGIEEFVSFELEPKILGEARLGYEEVHVAGNVRAAFRDRRKRQGRFLRPARDRRRFYRSGDRAEIFGARNPGQQADRIGRKDSVAREDDSANAGRRASTSCRSGRSGTTIFMKSSATSTACSAGVTRA